MKAYRVQGSEIGTVGGSDVLAFALELGALGGVAAWGWRSGSWLGAGAAAAAFTVAWGVFLSPRAARPITGMGWPAAKCAMFAASAVALGSVVGPLPAAAFLCLALVSVVLGGIR